MINHFVYAHAGLKLPWPTRHLDSQNMCSRSGAALTAPEWRIVVFRARSLMFRPLHMQAYANIQGVCRARTHAVADVRPLEAVSSIVS
jgi:hypothetical protein